MEEEGRTNAPPAISDYHGGALTSGDNPVPIVTLHIQPRKIADGVESSVVLNFRELIKKRMPSDGGIASGSFMTCYPVVFTDYGVGEVVKSFGPAVGAAAGRKHVFAMDGGEFTKPAICTMQIGLSTMVHQAVSEVMMGAPLDREISGEGGIIDCEDTYMVVNALPPGHDAADSIAIITGLPEAVAGRLDGDGAVSVRVLNWNTGGTVGMGYGDYKKYLAGQTFFGSVTRFPRDAIERIWGQDTKRTMETVACAQFKAIPFWCSGARDVTISGVVRQ